MNRHLRTARHVARDPRVPRWVRALLLIGILPIPGPVDEIGLVVGLVVLVVLYRPVIREHYQVQGLEPAELLDTWGAWS